jgi:hypothetical protein
MFHKADYAPDRRQLQRFSTGNPTGNEFSGPKHLPPVKFHRRQVYSKRGVLAFDDNAGVQAPELCRRHLDDDFVFTLRFQLDAIFRFGELLAVDSDLTGAL